MSPGLSATKLLSSCSFIVRRFSREAVYQVNYPLLHNLQKKGYLSVEADAFDLTQETFVRAYFNIRKFRPTAKFVTWLYNIALNLCRDHSRTQAYRYSSQTISTEVSAEENEWQRLPVTYQRDPAQQIEHREKFGVLEKAISELPQGLKAPLILTALEGRSHRQTGELLGISPKAVEMKVYRARKLLLGKMRKMGF